MLDHVRTASRPRWIAMSAFVVLMVVAFALLGRWQLHRAHAQNLSDAAKQTAMAAPAVAPDVVLQVGTPLPKADEWRTVTATGVYDATHQLLVRNRAYNSTNGYWVLVPLRTNGADLLVVRGWIPSGQTADAPDAVPAVPDGRVTVTGRVRQPEQASGSGGLPRGQLERVVPDQVAELTGRPTYGGWLTMQSESPVPGSAAAIQQLPADGSSGWSWPISHTVYAMQWFTFCLIAIVGWFVLLRRDVREGEPEKKPSTQDA